MRRITAAGLLMALTTPALALDCETGLRAYTHDLGTTCIPDEPQRIVSTVGEAVTVPLIELGVIPVGSEGEITSDGRPTLRGGLNNVGAGFDDLGIAHIGSFEPLDLETIAALAPDLIIQGAWGGMPVQQDYDQLSQIAPTIVLEIERRTGFQMHDALADVTNTGDILAANNRRYQYQVDVLRDIVPDGTSVSIIIPGEGEIYAYHAWPGLGQIFRDAGFAHPVIIDNIPEGQSDTFSVEALEQFDADWLFISYANHRGETPADAMARMNALLPPWCETLSACRNDRVVFVPIVEAASWSTDAYYATVVSLIQTMGNPLRYADES